MAQDQLCKFCEESDEQERGVLLICDLTGSGELPFAIGINCLPDWLTTMLEAIAIPEGIPASAPAELDDSIVDDDDVVSFPGDAYDRAQTGEEPESHEEAVERRVAAMEAAGVGEALKALAEDPTATLEPSGPSPVESSAPDTGNGNGKTLSKARTSSAKPIR